MFNLLRGNCLIVLIAKLTLSSNIKLSAIFALVSDLIVRMVLSTWPVPVCKFGVHLMRFFSVTKFFEFVTFKTTTVVRTYPPWRSVICTKFR